MIQNCKKLGEYIEEIDQRVENSDDSYLLDDIFGISSVTKEFVDTKANLVDVSVDTYKIVPPNCFAFNPNTARMGDKICIALNKSGKNILVSSIYPVFKIKDTTVLFPDYLMMWFRRSEFDRYARYMSHGSAREIFDWEKMCDVMLPIPEIDRQKRKVKSYQTVVNRLVYLENENSNLLNLGLNFYKKEIANYYLEGSKLPVGWEKCRLDTLCDVKGGKRLPAGEELVDYETKHPYIRVRDVKQNLFVWKAGDFQFVTDDVYNDISKYIVNKDDVIITIVGTIGLIGKIHSSLDGANLTENCMKFVNLKRISSNYLFCDLSFKKEKRIIEENIVGAVQPKLPMYNLQALQIIVPEEKVLEKLENKLSKISSLIEANTQEIQELFKLKELISSFNYI